MHARRAKAIKSDTYEEILYFFCVLTFIRSYNLGIDKTHFFISTKKKEMSVNLDCSKRL